jgi:catechol 2,3-dioxygenase-like lactoylglutathione lyase family enzyme
MTDLAAFLLAPFKQVALVVENLDESVRTWHDRLGIGPWTAWRLGPPILQDMTYRGTPAAFEFRHALAWQGDVQFELVQPVSGPSIFADHLRQHGPGLHHVGKYVADHQAAVRAVLADGFTAIQGAHGFGAEGDGAFAYFDPPGTTGLVVELIEAPRVRIEPEFIYPPAAS